MNYNTATTTKHQFSRKLTRCLVESLVRPLRELIDILLESLIYTNRHRHRTLVNVLLNIRENIKSSNVDARRLTDTYELIVMFLEEIDQLNSRTLQSLELIIKQCFHFFKSFFESFQLFHTLDEHIHNNKNLNDKRFVLSMKEFVTFNKQWYIELMIHSSGYKEFLSTKNQILPNSNNHPDIIIESDLFKSFLSKRKQRLLTESLVNRYRSCII